MELKFDYDEGKISQLIDQSLEAIHNLILEIEIETKPTFANTFDVLEPLYQKRQVLIGACEILRRVAEKEVIRISALDACQMAGQFDTQTYLRPTLYDRLMAATPSTPEQKQVQLEWKHRFEQYGTHLPEEDRKGICKLLNEHDALTQQYREVLQKDTAKCMIKIEELKGMSPDFILATEYKQRICRILPAHAAHVLAHCTVPKTCERVSTMLATRAEKNVKTFEKIQHKKAHISTLLGFEHHAALQLDRATLTREEIDQLLESVAPQGPQVTQPVPDLASHFPREHVLQNVLKYVAELANVTIQSTKRPTWHKDVLVYEITDQKEPAKKGWFYIDVKEQEVQHPMAVRHIPMTEGLFPSGALLGALPPQVAPHHIANVYHECLHMVQQVLNRQPYWLISGLKPIPFDTANCLPLVLEEWVYGHLSLLAKTSITPKDLETYELHRKQVHAEQLQKQAQLAQADLAIFSSPCISSKDIIQLYTDIVKQPPNLGTWVDVACYNSAARMYVGVFTSRFATALQPGLDFSNLLRSNVTREDWSKISGLTQLVKTE